MKNAIMGFKQREAFEYNLDFTDLALLNYITLAQSNSKMLHIKEGEVSYVWLKHSKILEDLPLMYIGETTLKHRLAKLKNSGFIMVNRIANNTLQGSMSHYSITEKTITLLSDDFKKITCFEEQLVEETKSLKNDVVEQPSVKKSTWSKRPSVKKSTSNSKLSINSKLDNNIIITINSNNNTEISKKEISSHISENNSINNLGTITDIQKKSTKRKKINRDVEIEDNLVTDDKSYSKSDFLGSVGKKSKQAEKSEDKKPKKNLYQKCIDEIYNITDDEELITVLKDYLDFHLQNNKNGKFNSVMWHYILDKLKDIDDKVGAVKNSLERGYLSIYPAKNNYSMQSAKNNPALSPDVVCERCTTTNEERIAILKAQGKQWEF